MWQKNHPYFHVAFVLRVLKLPQFLGNLTLYGKYYEEAKLQKNRIAFFHSMTFFEMRKLTVGSCKSLYNLDKRGDLGHNYIYGCWV